MHISFQVAKITSNILKYCLVLFFIHNGCNSQIMLKCAHLTLITNNIDNIFSIELHFTTLNLFYTKMTV